MFWARNYTFFFTFSHFSPSFFTFWRKKFVFSREKLTFVPRKQSTTSFIHPFIKLFTTMKKYVCDPCGYVYDPELGDPDNGIAPGTAFEDLPDDWVCPICGVGKEDFSAEE